MCWRHLADLSPGQWRCRHSNWCNRACWFHIRWQLAQHKRLILLTQREYTVKNCWFASRLHRPNWFGRPSLWGSRWFLQQDEYSMRTAADLFHFWWGLHRRLWSRNCLHRFDSNKQQRFAPVNKNCPKWYLPLKSTHWWNLPRGLNPRICPLLERKHKFVCWERGLCSG